ncbi:hypothetical protein ACH42_06915 [Endozoicomonas sp. (ex Bugula neritina AB1)]|nr:hypothetical protein ACH42_06915 [Endozoicomonas sp. (ex Bugula neritina AB1)]
MRYLKIRTETKPRKDGSHACTPLVCEASHRYDKHRTEKAMKRLACQLILGAADSGKTRWLSRLHEKWEGIWGSKIKAEPVYLSALQPLSSWTDAPHVEAWYEQQEAEDEPHKRAWSQLNQQQRAEQLANYIDETGALLFIDDAHKLTGRKLQAARACVLASRIWLMSASQENRLAPNLRTIVERREPQRTRLQTEASYDATNFVMWTMIALSVGIGWWEAGLVLGGMKMLGTGRRAARPE